VNPFHTGVPKALTTGSFDHIRSGRPQTLPSERGRSQERAEVEGRSLGTCRTTHHTRPFQSQMSGRQTCQHARTLNAIARSCRVLHPRRSWNGAFRLSFNCESER
jgi:hypothetical protein